MPETIVTRILRLPGYGVYAWDAEATTGTLTLWVRQTAREPFYVCGGCGISVRDVQLDGAPASRSAVRDVAGVAGAGGPPGAVSALWGPDRARGLRGGQGARDHAPGAGRGPRV